MNTQKHIFKGFILFFAIVLCITGCKNNKQGKNGRPNDIQFDSIQVEKEYYLLNNTENPHCDLKINFLYPVKSSSPAVLDAVRNDFVITFFNEQFEGLTPQEAMEKFTEEYLKEYKGLEEYYQEDIRQNHDAPVTAWYNYYEIRYNEINYNSNNVLSYSCYRESFTGGAHGSHLLRNRVINLNTGDVITENDIFTDGYQEPLAKILIRHITEQNEVAEPKELEDIGYFSIDEIYPNNNFLVDDSGITYDFNEYEIAAYVVGITSIHIPYQEIRHLLQAESPISHLFN
ncbi:MAG: DUF3298 and DUF4163 domain-containing protein [Tannerellaceae bacterium]|nr:DUF3298 and DUF4163 domain-containing protein [Tannerellaceae bacterium]